MKMLLLQDWCSKSLISHRACVVSKGHCVGGELEREAVVKMQELY